MEQACLQLSTSVKDYEHALHHKDGEEFFEEVQKEAANGYGITTSRSLAWC